MSRAPADRGWRCRDRGSDLHRTPDLRCRLRNERAAYERPRGTAVSRLGCRTRQPCRCIRHRPLSSQDFARRPWSKPLGIRRHGGCEGLKPMLRITDILYMTADGRGNWMLRLEGTLKDEWVRELRRGGRGVREGEAGGAGPGEAAEVRFGCPGREWL